MQPEQNAQTWAPQGSQPAAAWQGQAPYPSTENQPPQDGAAWPAQAAYPGGATWPGQSAPAAGRAWAANPAADGTWAAGGAWATAPAADGTWTPPAAGGAWAGQSAYAGQQAPAGAAGPGYPSSSAPQPPGAEPSGLWQGQAAYPPAYQAHQTPAAPWSQQAPPSGQWQGQPAMQQMPVPQAAMSAGVQWQGQPGPSPESGGHWQAQATAQQAAMPVGGQWQSQAVTQEAPAAPSGLWQAQAQETTEPSGLRQAPGAQPAAPQDAYPAPEPRPGLDEAQPWMIQFNSQPHVAPARRRGPSKGVAIGLVALVAVLGALAGGVNAYAKHEVCSQLKGESSALNQSSASSDAGPTDAELAQMRKDADTLRGYGHMLVFSGGLREAVNGLAADEDEMVNLVKSAGAASPTDEAAAKKALTELVTVVGSVNSHARQAQSACGLPVTGILGS